MGLWLFGIFGVLAIAGGGVLSAFSAKKPDRFASWASAYLVLIVGLLQTGLGASLHYLAIDPAAWMIILAFVLYNLGNAGVLLGTYLKKSKKLRALVDVGGALIGIAMILLLVIMKDAKLSPGLIAFYVFVLIILISMPIGLALSRKHSR